jgi:hypothetical protein
MTDEEVKVPLTDFVKGIAREAAFVAAREVIEEHKKTCPASINMSDVLVRLRGLEIRFSTLVGLMIGSGILGGGISVGLAKLIGI